MAIMLTVDYWERIQAHHRAGRVPRVSTYPAERRLVERELGSEGEVARRLVGLEASHPEYQQALDHDVGRRAGVKIVDMHDGLIPKRLHRLIAGPGDMRGHDKVGPIEVLV